MIKRFLTSCGLLAGLGLTAPLLAQVPTGKVGIGTTAPTQTLDVNGNLRVRGLTGSGNRLPALLPDGTLGVNAPLFATDPTPGAPTAATGSVATANRPTDVAVSGTRAYVVNMDLSLGNNNRTQLQVFDVATPDSPALLGSVLTGYGVLRVAAAGSIAYVINQATSTLQVVDATFASTPGIRATVGTATGPRSVAVSGTTVYVVCQGNGGSVLQVFDASNPNAPRLRGSTGIDPVPTGVAVSGTTAYVVNYNNQTLQTFDVANPRAPTLLGTAGTPTDCYGVAASGTTAYVVSYGNQTLLAYDVSNPSVPVLRGSVGSTGPLGVAVSGPNAYVISNQNSLQTVDVSTPSAPTLRGSAATGNNPVGIAANGTTAYVVNSGSSTLQVFAAPNVSRTVAVNPDGSLASVPTPTLSLSGQKLSISNGNSILLPDASATNEVQTLSKSGNAVTLNSVGGVGGGSFTDDDSQQLSLNGNTLSLTNGGSVTISTGADNLGDHLATQNLDLGSNALVGNGGSTGLRIASTGVVTTASALQVGGLLRSNSLISNAIGTLNDFGSLDAGVYYKSGGQLQVVSAGADRLLVDALGRVGIGTTAPAATLDVNGPAAVAGALTVASVRSPATGSNNLLPAAYGLCFSGATALATSSLAAGSYAIAHVANSGVYTITFGGSSGLAGVNFGTLPVTVSLYGNAAGLLTWSGGTGVLTVNTFAAGSGGITAADRGFSFAVYRP
jgi:hypothetical protein